MELLVTQQESIIHDEICMTHYTTGLVIIRPFDLADTCHLVFQAITTILEARSPNYMHGQ